MRLPSAMTRWMILAVALSVNLAHAHTIITYPGYRGNNLHTNGTVEDTNGLSQAWVNGSYVWPYGMEWAYPCGGMPTSTNRTKWPVGGGAFAFQPGWFPGHSKAFIYINMGFGTIPPNMSHILKPVFQITGPTNNPYPGTVCIPHLPLPPNITVNVGDHATIQLIEAAQHGAGLFNCVDIEFADPKDVELVTRDNCLNSTWIGFDLVYATTSLTSGAPSLRLSSSLHVFAVLSALVTAFVATVL